MVHTYNFKDFFSDGPWAVVDAFYGCIWINVQTLDLARHIKEAFTYKINPAIVDISKSPDYAPGLIDDAVCLNWHLEPVQHKSVITLPELDDHEHADYTQDGMNLINSPNRLSMGSDLCVEIQNQIRSFIMIYRSIEYQGIPNDLLSEIKDCYSIEMTLPNIEQRLYSLTDAMMDQHPRKCLEIMFQLARLYD